MSDHILTEFLVHVAPCKLFTLLILEGLEATASPDMIAGIALNSIAELTTKLTVI
jgi:hypothetical protein